MSQQPRRSSPVSPRTMNPSRLDPRAPSFRPFTPAVMDFSGGQSSQPPPMAGAPSSRPFSLPVQRPQPPTAPRAYYEGGPTFQSNTPIFRDVQWGPDPRLVNGNHWPVNANQLRRPALQPYNPPVMNRQWGQDPRLVNGNYWPVNANHERRSNTYEWIQIPPVMNGQWGQDPRLVNGNQVNGNQVHGNPRPLNANRERGPTLQPYIPPVPYSQRRPDPRLVNGNPRRSTTYHAGRTSGQWAAMRIANRERRQRRSSQRSSAPLANGQREASPPPYGQSPPPYGQSPPPYGQSPPPYTSPVTDFQSQPSPRPLDFYRPPAAPLANGQRERSSPPPQTVNGQRTQSLQPSAAPIVDQERRPRPQPSAAPIVNGQRERSSSPPPIVNGQGQRNSPSLEALEALISNGHRERSPEPSASLIVDQERTLYSPTSTNPYRRRSPQPSTAPNVNGQRERSSLPSPIVNGRRLRLIPQPSGLDTTVGERTARMMADGVSNVRSDWPLLPPDGSGEEDSFLPLAIGMENNIFIVSRKLVYRWAPGLRSYVERIMWEREAAADSNENKIVVDRIDDQSFSLFLHWIYHGRIFAEHAEPPSVDLLIRLHVLAAYFEIPILQNLAVHYICKLSLENEDPRGRCPVHMMNYVWDNSGKDSWLRELMVDMLAYDVVNRTPTHWRAGLGRCGLSLSLPLMLNSEMQRYLERLLVHRITYEPNTKDELISRYLRHMDVTSDLIRVITSGTESNCFAPPLANPSNYFVSEEG